MVKGGKDTVYGLGGKDIICGGDGGDILKGGDGPDILKGGVGADTLNGSAGTDTCTGGSGFDRLFSCNEPATTGTLTITADTTLAAPHKGEIVIGADDVTLDCDGHILTGPGSGRGIEIVGRSGTRKARPTRGRRVPLAVGEGAVHATGRGLLQLRAAMSGTAVSGKFKWTGQLTDHYVGIPETWRENLSGRTWGITLPGYGTVLQQTGDYKQTTIIHEDGVWECVPDHDWWTGVNTFDLEALCAYFGYDLVLP